MHHPDHFPCSRSSALSELGRLRNDVATSRRERAQLLAAEQEMIAEAATIERTIIADLDQHEPPNAIVADACGAWWQVVGEYLRPVPVCDGMRMVRGVEQGQHAESAPTPVHRCDCNTCRDLAAIHDDCGTAKPGVSRVELTDDPGPNYRVLVARNGDALADPIGVARVEACMRHGSLMRERRVVNGVSNHSDWEC
jgi:hypothetical protein